MLLVILFAPHWRPQFSHAFVKPKTPIARGLWVWQSVSRILSLVRIAANEGRSFIWALDRSRARCGTLLLSQERGLAPRKDFAVSLPLFCPYRGIGPTTSGWGPPIPFGTGRHCSHLSACAVRPLAATFLTCRSKWVSGLSSPRHMPQSDRLDCQPTNYTTNVNGKQ